MQSDNTTNAGIRMQSFRLIMMVALSLVDYPGPVCRESSTRLRCGWSDATGLAELGPLSPIPWAQRLGYLLERVGQRSRTEPLAAFVARRASETASLIPEAELSEAPRDERRKLRVNADVEPDL